jgi:hypothetical protein
MVFKTLLGFSHVRLKVFDNGVLKKIFGLKRDEAKGEEKKLYNEELHFTIVLPLTEHHATKAYWGSGGTAPHIL